MNIHEQKKLEDGKSILKIRDDNVAKMSDYPAVNSDIDEVKDIIDAIDEKSPEQGTDNTGVAIDKDASKNALAEVVFEHGQLSGSYFRKIGDMTNFKKVDVKLYILKRMKPADLKIAAVNMVKVCTEFVVPLGPYKITTVTIAKITAANAAFAPLSNEPKVKRQETKITTTAIRDLFKRYTSLVNLRLRGSLIAMSGPDPELYNKFISLTFEDKVGAHSHFPPSVITGILIIKATDVITGEPIEGVSIRVVGFPYVAHTDQFGIAIIEAPIGNQVIKLIAFDHLACEFSIMVTVEEQHKDVEMSLAS